MVLAIMAGLWGRGVPFASSASSPSIRLARSTVRPLPVEAEAGARGRWRAVAVVVGGEAGRARACEPHYSESERGQKRKSYPKALSGIEMSQDYAHEQFKLYWQLSLDFAILSFAALLDAPTLPWGLAD